MTTEKLVKIDSTEISSGDVSQSITARVQQGAINARTQDQSVTASGTYSPAPGVSFSGGGITAPAVLVPPISSTEHSDIRVQMDDKLASRYGEAGLFRKLHDYAAMIDLIEIVQGRGVNDSFTLTDQLQSLFAKAVSHPVMLTDTASKLFEKAYSHNALITESMSPVVSSVRLYQEGVTVSDSVSKALDLNKMHSIAVSDNVLISAGFLRDLAFTFVLSDTIGMNISSSYFDNNTLYDVFVASLAMPRSHSHSFAVSDTVSKEPGRIIASAFSITDFETVVIGKAFTDVVSFIETVTFNPGFSRTYGHVFTAADSLSLDYGMYGYETSSMSEFITKVIERATVETSSISEAIAKLIDTAYNEPLSITDTSMTDVSKAIPETVSHTETKTAHMQSYFASDYAAEDYAGQNYTL